MDVDGTLTDGKVYIGDGGELFKAFNIKDGYGIHDIAISKGITPVIITGRKSEIVVRRCKELGIDNIFQGVSDKFTILNEVTNNLAEVVYIGDDINDILCMRMVKEAGGFVACPQDAVKQVKDIADCITSCKGGDGAVRELIDILFSD